MSQPPAPTAAANRHSDGDTGENENENLTFTIAPATESDLPDVTALFALYAQSLNIDLTFQSFAEELAGLPGKYAPPTGQILLARRVNPPHPPHPHSDSHDDTNGITARGEAIGCVAVRPITLQTGNDKEIKRCEMKRLYALPSTRGQGVGRALVASVVEAAAGLGYREMYLDTLASMDAARGLYSRFGFEGTEAYYHNPHDGVVFLVKRL
ncbi:Acetyltransferase [Drechslerella dactyloides]|uniref:Acetyltransferase n=1 Tax=Drechslerella dactyloides TaxID=74499 RepID=A0AAD6IXW7_DREDA|nr:Acetyltransferase [Drechslerella dactyloides]